MKKIFLVLCLCSITFANWTKSTPVGPNIIHHHEYRSQGPWHLHVLEIDATQVWNTFETVKANDLLYGNEQTSSMASRNSSEGHRVVGAINGDFYAAGGIPIGTQVLQGEMLKKPHPSRSVFGLNTGKIPFIEKMQFSGMMVAQDNVTRNVNGINETRQTDYLVVYNKYFGAATGTNIYGTEIIAKYISGQNFTNDSVKVVVTAKDSIMSSGHGSNTIPQNGVVLSGHGTASDYLNQHVFVNDTVTFILNLAPVVNPVKEAIGGTPRLIRDGQVSVEWQGEGLAQSFATDRHPRTAVGFSQDSSKVYFFTVDGRQPGYSVGMSLYELADYMMEWNIYQGVNLDGGGSTTMVVRGNVVNSPSDQNGERPVANALMIVSTAPTGPLANLRISPDDVYAIVDEQVQFRAKGFDQYYNPVSLAGMRLQWECSASIGTIDSYGLFTAGSGTGAGYVFVTSGSVVDSVKVTITEVSSIYITPNPVILEVGENQQMEAVAQDNLGNIVALNNTDFTWWVTDSIGSIDTNGLFSAEYTGEGFIYAGYENIVDSVITSVGISNIVTVDDFSNVDNWSLTGVRVNLTNCNISADSAQAVSLPTSGRLDYSLTTGGTSALYMNCTIPISGTPDAIGLYVYGDGMGHWLRGEFQDADGEKFLLNFTDESPGINWNDTWNYIEIPFTESIIHWSNPNAVLTYPVTWKRIYLAEIDDGNKNDGTIFLDDFQVRFITKIRDDGSLKPVTYNLHQNYPNPFNPETTIVYSIPETKYVKLIIYDINGKLIEKLVQGRQKKGTYSIKWDASDYASGIYFYKLHTDNFADGKKMLVVK